MAMIVDIFSDCQNMLRRY